MYRRKEGKKKVKIGAHKGLILTLPFVLLNNDILVQIVCIYMDAENRFDVAQIETFVII